MITLSLTDFQAHKQTKLEVTERLACITGPTNAGKSSIVRAIRWVLYDGIRGARFVRSGQASAKASIRFEDGVEVERVKGKAENRYRVGANWFDAIGIGPPPEVVTATNVPLLQVDKDTAIELHVSSQLKPLLLVMDVASLRAKTLNTLTGGHVIDAAIRETNLKLRKFEAQKEERTSKLAEAEQQLKACGDLVAQEQVLKRIKVMFDQVSQHRQRSSSLQSINATLTHVREVRKKAEALSSVLRSKASIVQQYLEDLSRTSEIGNLLKKLRTIRAQRIDVEHSLIRSRQALQELADTIASHPDFVCPACGQLVTKDIRARHFNEHPLSV